MKWLLIRFNLLLQKIRLPEKGAWEGYNRSITEYNREYRVFSTVGIALKEYEGTSRIFLQNIEDGLKGAESGIQWRSSEEDAVVIENCKEGIAEVKARKPGLAEIFCEYQGRHYGMELQVFSKEMESRLRALNYMYRMAVVPWQSREKIFYRPTKGRVKRAGFEIFYFDRGVQYYGIPYTNRKAEKEKTLLETFTMAEMEFNEEDAVAYKREKVYNAAYPGNDCSTALWRAWNVQKTGDARKNFFGETLLAYPSTFTLMQLPINKEKQGDVFAVETLMEGDFKGIRCNWKEGFDTRKAVRHSGNQVKAYEKLLPSDACIRFTRMGIFRSGHVMLVRRNDKENQRVYFMDQHSVPHKNRPVKRGHMVAPGQSTFSTWYSMTYQQLGKYGYLPIRLK